MKIVDVSLFEISPSEAQLLEDGTPVLIYDTQFQHYGMVKASENAVYNRPTFDDERFLLLLFTQPIYKKVGKGNG